MHYLNRLIELTPGTKAPDFNVGVKDSVSLKSYQKKYLYIQFIDPSIKYYHSDSK